MSEQYATIYKQILETIHASKHVMIVMHQKPDGDTAGSALALAHYLDIINKPHTCFCIDELSSTFHFLPGHQKITNDISHWHPEKALFDLVIVLDAGDLKYAGIADYIDQLTHDFKIINIDHHATNTQFGEHNLVISEASSTCEIIHNLLNSVHALNKEIATCLMTGLVTDTSGFTNLATTASSIEAASKLLLKGANLKQISNKTLNNRSVTALKLWGRALERLTPTPYGIVLSFITQTDIQEFHASVEDIEGVANFLNSLDEQTHAKAVLLLTEREPGKIKGSLRTTHPLIDVSKIAILCGGGGHKKAAGFTIHGTFQNINNQWMITTSTEK